MSETPVAFARVCLCGVETAIAFAGEKWAYLVQFLGAEVTPVSPVLCWGRAVVLLVSTSPRCRASVKSWGCAHVVDGSFMRLLSRPLGVVRIRWGICRRGWCRRCGCQGVARDTVVRRLAHEPCGWRPTILHVSVRRYRCPECAHVWHHTPYGDRYVTVILDVTPVRDRRGPSQLLDMVLG